MHVSLICRQHAKKLLNFVPNSRPTHPSDIEQMQKFVDQAGKILVLTGAGVSTESGIPDYRSEEVGLYARTDRRPIQYQEFVRSEEGRQRYWARNFVGWPRFASFEPNLTHRVLRKWEEIGKLQWLVTQNVDALHTKAGNKKLTELHGCSARVVCLTCDNKMDRWDVQKMIIDLNPNFNITSDAIAPDGDVSLTEKQVKDFKVPPCPSCGGVLKPDVVFFGDNVARPLVENVFDQVDKCDSVLILGSSLYVYSGYRFITHASKGGKPIAIINIGDTRADHLTNLKLERKCSEILSQVHFDSS